ncbi:MAG: PIN domain-containing protein [Acidobacteriota bacterium]
MSGELVDTNVLVYAHDLSAGARRKTATELLERLMAASSGVLSTQVLMEFYVTVTRKLPRPMKPGTAAAIVEDFGTWPVFAPGVDDIVAGAALAERYLISFWDAMIVRAAQVMGAALIWSEDLSSGQSYGGVEVRNPFSTVQA